jgi:hypothetical protein
MFYSTGPRRLCSQWLLVTYTFKSFVVLFQMYLKTALIFLTVLAHCHAWRKSRYEYPPPNPQRVPEADNASAATTTVEDETKQIHIFDVILGFGIPLVLTMS